MSQMFAPQLLQMPAAAASLPYLVLDVETSEGSPSDADRWIRECWLPDAIETWKEETIGKRLKAAHAKKKEKLALMDAAPVIAVSLRTEPQPMDSGLRCLHAMEEHSPKSLYGALVEGFASTRDMLTALASFLNARCSTDTIIAGFNLLHFDLKKLRYAFLKERVALPRALLGKDQAVYDMQRMFVSQFSQDRTEIMPSLHDLLHEFGIDSHKALADGALIPRLYEQRQFDLIIRYSLLDAIAEATLFCRMTGRDAP